MKIRLAGFWKVWTFLVIAAVLAACSPLQKAEPTATTQVAAEQITTQTVEPTELTVTQTPSPQPQTRQVILVAPAGSDAARVLEVEQDLNELAEQAQMTLITREALQPGDLTSDVAVTVWLDAPANLAELASGAPQTIFIVFSQVDIQAGANVSVIRIRPEYQVFVGGFIVALLSPDWRTAGLLPADGPLGAGLADAFVNGGHYFCGVCAPGWPLQEYYPQVGSLPSASDGPAWQASATSLFDEKKVDAYYLSSEAAKTEILAYLAGKDQFGVPVRVVGAVPAPVELADQWAATVQFDLSSALELAWAEAAAGKGGVSTDAPVIVKNINSNHLGDGKLRLVNELLEEIKAGRIFPYTVPAQ